MPIDEVALESLRSYDDRRRGITERFITPIIGGLRTVGVLSVPTQGQRDRGWAICHSLGMEQVWLQPLEVAAARSLSASGFAVLRFHAQGYGDSEGRTEDATLASLTDNALEALDLLLAEARVSRVGLVGGRMGATIAAIAAERSQADGVVLWEPVIDGRRHMESLLRISKATELGIASGVKAVAQDPLQIFARDGVLDVQGFPLQRAVFDEVSAFDLLSTMTSFTGRSLVVQISKSSKPKPELERLVERMNEIGGRSALRILEDSEARSFGFQRYYAAPGGQRKEDKHAAMSEGLVSLTTATCLEWDDGDARRPVRA